jgi:prepilin-type N-terminal cleavage/methylation domain-containing protein
MSRDSRKSSQSGFTLIELMVALGIFLLVCGAAFTLLGSSQQRYKTESQVLTSFQEARLALDQIVRDVNDAGFPPPTFIDPSYPERSASSPFAWSPSYPGTPCQIGTGGGGTCTTSLVGNTSPGDFDLIIETNPNPQTNPKVQWIRYQLQGPTLFRGVADKVFGDDPDVDTSGQLVPLVQNVVNVTAPPGGIPVPIFSYICDTPTVPQYPAPTCASLGMGADNSPKNIRDVTVTLIVSTPTPDATTGALRIVKLTGRGRRVNPSQ